MSGELFTSHHLSQNKIIEFQRLTSGESTEKAIQSSQKKERRRKEKEEKEIQKKKKRLTVVKLAEDLRIVVVSNVQLMISVRDVKPLERIEEQEEV